MCGFVGIVSLGASASATGFDAAHDRAARLDRMSAAIAHRGPDEHAMLDAGFVRLAFRRLSIIDPEGGHQPVESADGRVACVLNGELYDHREQRARLVRSGRPVVGGSDAAVLPGLYELDGPDLARPLDGMFAIAVVDRAARTVHLIRDRSGIKPLYIARIGDVVLFASELRALLASGLVDATLDETAAACLASFRFVPGTETVVRGIERVAPGGCVSIEAAAGRIRRRRWWHPAEAADAARRERGERGDDLGAILDRSVARQIVADVPVGLSVSGGIDSALVAESACRAARATGGAMPTAFTTVFPGAEDDPHGELAHARALCRTLGLRHVEVPVAAAAFGRALDDLVALGDEPCLDPALLPAAAVARAASREVRVLLSGTGGDELFGGYGHYRPGPHHRALAALPPLLRTAAIHCLASRRGGTDPIRLDRLETFGSIGARGGDRRRLQIAGRQVADRALRDILFGPRALEAEARFLDLWPLARAIAGADDPAAAPLRHDLVAYLPDQLLLLLDRTTMAASIEGRVPLLGTEVVAAGLARRAAECVGVRHGLKRPLRDLAAARLPGDIAAAIVRAPKRGWHTPVDRWLVDDPAGLELARSVLLDRDAALEPFADPSSVRTFLAGAGDLAATRRRRATGAVHALVMLVRWHERARNLVADARRRDATRRPAIPTRHAA